MLTRGWTDCAAAATPPPSIRQRRPTPRHGAAARGRRGAAGQHDHARVRLEGGHRQSRSASIARNPWNIGHDARRLQRRGGRGRSAGHGRPAYRHRWRRLHPHPGRLSAASSGSSRPSAASPLGPFAVRHGRPSRADDPQRGGRGPDAHRDQRAGRARLAFAAARRHGLPARSGSRRRRAARRGERRRLGSSRSSPRFVRGSSRRGCAGRSRRPCAVGRSRRSVSPPASSPAPGSRPPRA